MPSSIIILLNHWNYMAYLSCIASMYLITWLQSCNTTTQLYVFRLANPRLLFLPFAFSCSQFILLAFSGNNVTYAQTMIDEQWIILTSSSESSHMYSANRMRHENAFRLNILGIQCACEKCTVFLLLLVACNKSLSVNIYPIFCDEKKLIETAIHKTIWDIYHLEHSNR